ncbi:hypothetical protein BGZ94_008826 [Podila epigama]|nr:hypothetical protein BGZ94_008826 [Podila epigama]
MPEHLSCIFDLLQSDDDDESVILWDTPASPNTTRATFSQSIGTGQQQQQRQQQQNHHHASSASSSFSTSIAQTHTHSTLPSSISTSTLASDTTGKRWSASEASKSKDKANKDAPDNTLSKTQEKRVIMAATVEKLVAKLTSDIDTIFLTDFFLVYRLFITPISLMTLLLARFQWALANDSPQHQIVRIRTFVTLRHWILHFYGYDLVAAKGKLYKILNTFLKSLHLHPTVVASPREQRIVRDLRKHLKTQKKLYRANNVEGKGTIHSTSVVDKNRSSAMNPRSLDETMAKMSRPLPVLKTHESTTTSGSTKVTSPLADNHSECNSADNHGNTTHLNRNNRMEAGERWIGASDIQEDCLRLTPDEDKEPEKYQGVETGGSGSGSGSGELLGKSSTPRRAWKQGLPSPGSALSWFSSTSKGRMGPRIRAASQTNPTTRQDYFGSATFLQDGINNTTTTATTGGIVKEQRQGNMNQAFDSTLTLGTLDKQQPQQPSQWITSTHRRSQSYSHHGSSSIFSHSHLALPTPDSLMSVEPYMNPPPRSIETSEKILMWSHYLTSTVEHLAKVKRVLTTRASLSTDVRPGGGGGGGGGRRGSEGGLGLGGREGRRRSEGETQKTKEISSRVSRLTKPSRLWNLSRTQTNGSMTLSSMRDIVKEEKDNIDGLPVYISPMNNKASSMGHLPGLSPQTPIHNHHHSNHPLVMVHADAGEDIPMVTEKSRYALFTRRSGRHSDASLTSTGLLSPTTSTPQLGSSDSNAGLGSGTGKNKSADTGIVVNKDTSISVVGTSSGIGSGSGHSSGNVNEEKEPRAPSPSPWRVFSSTTSSLFANLFSQGQLTAEGKRLMKRRAEQGRAGSLDSALGGRPSPRETSSSSSQIQSSPALLLGSARASKRQGPSPLSRSSVSRMSMEKVIGHPILLTKRSLRSLRKNTREQLAQDARWVSTEETDSTGPSGILSEMTPKTVKDEAALALEVPKKQAVASAVSDLTISFKETTNIPRKNSLQLTGAGPTSSASSKIHASARQFHRRVASYSFSFSKPASMATRTGDARKVVSHGHSHSQPLILSPVEGNPTVEMNVIQSNGVAAVNNTHPALIRPESVPFSLATTNSVTLLKSREHERDVTKLAVYEHQRMRTNSNPPPILTSFRPLESESCSSEKDPQPTGFKNNSCDVVNRDDMEHEGVNISNDIDNGDNNHNTVPVDGYGYNSASTQRPQAPQQRAEPDLPPYVSMVLMYRSELIAQQLCLIERDLLLRIQWFELVDGGWTKKKQQEQELELEQEQEQEQDQKEEEEEGEEEEAERCCYTQDDGPDTGDPVHPLDAVPSPKTGVTSTSTSTSTPKSQKRTWRGGAKGQKAQERMQTRFPKTVEETSPNIKQLVDRFNRTCEWVTSEILKTTDDDMRVKVVEKFIRIAHICYNHSNFSSLTQIMLGLQHHTVSRLSRTWERVRSEEIKTMQELTVFTSPFHNFKHLRNAMKVIAEEWGGGPAIGGPAIGGVRIGDIHQQQQQQHSLVTGHSPGVAVKNAFSPANSFTGSMVTTPLIPTPPLETASISTAILGSGASGRIGSGKSSFFTRRQQDTHRHIQDEASGPTTTTTAMVLGSVEDTVSVQLQHQEGGSIPFLGIYLSDLVYNKELPSYVEPKAPPKDSKTGYVLSLATQSNRLQQLPTPKSSSGNLNGQTEAMMTMCSDHGHIDSNDKSAVKSRFTTMQSAGDGTHIPEQGREQGREQKDSARDHGYHELYEPLHRPQMLVNMHKHRTTATIIKRILTFQTLASRYPFQRDPVVFEWLQTMEQSMLDRNDFERQSTLCEQRK